MTQEARPTPILDDAVLDALLVNLKPIAPPPERAAALRERVLAVAHADTVQADIAPDDKITIHGDAGKWTTIAPKVSMKLLHVTPESRSFLLRLEPGASLAAHDHPGDEECMVLEGEVFLDGVRAVTGAFHLAPKGTHHTEIRSPEGALLYLRVDSAGPVRGWLTGLWLHFLGR